ncbi:transcription factor SOX-30 [Lithobates pipiens]
MDNQQRKGPAQARRPLPEGKKEGRSGETGQSKMKKKCSLAGLQSKSSTPLPKSPQGPEDQLNPTAQITPDLHIPMEPTAKINTTNAALTVHPSEAGIPDPPFSRNRNGQIKQPINAYIIWARIQCQALRKANPTATFAEISEMLGTKWKKLSEEDKKPYYEKSYEIKKEHHKAFPDWKFQPHRKNKSTSFNKSSVTATSGYRPTSFLIPKPIQNTEAATLPLLPQSKRIVHSRVMGLNTHKERLLYLPYPMI